MKWDLCTDCVDFQRQEKDSLLFHCINKKSKFFGFLSSHKLTWRVCTLYKERISEQLKGIRFIEDLRGSEKFKNSTFWIIGADPNLDFYQPPYCSDDFFKDKFSITVNMVWHVFPDSTFHIADWAVAGADMKNDVRCDLKKCIFSLKIDRLLPSADTFGLSHPLQGRDLEPIYMRTEKGRPMRFKSEYRSMVREIFGDDPVMFSLIGTTTHMGICAAVMLGARRIILVACSHKLKFPVLKFHAHRKGLEKYIEADNKVFDYATRRAKEWERRLRGFVEIFKEHDIEIIRHRYDEKEKKFVFEEIKE